MRQWTFENDNGKCPQMDKALFYAANWEEMKAENIGYLLWGKAGTGKSYFAGCIANALMEREISVCMTNFALILNDLSASYKGRNEYIDRLCRFPLLILDDFGMERGTEYGLEQVYNVVDSRTAAPLDAKPDLVKRIGNTTFDIHIHFSETSRETFTDKVVRLIENDKDSVTD